jgi:hypothetical protein
MELTVPNTGLTSIKLPPFNRQNNRVTRTQLREAIERNYVTPFKDVLSQLMQCRPTPEAILAFALDHPDKWANTVAIFAKLSGYREQVDINITAPEQMGDAQLLQRLSELRTQLGFTPALEAASQEAVPKLNTPLDPIPIDQAPTIHGPLSRRKKSTKKGNQ